MCAFSLLFHRQLSTEQAVLQESLEKESKVNKRLSMENEELLWKLHNGDLCSPKKLSPSSPPMPFQSPRNSGSFSSPTVSPRWHHNEELSVKAFHPWSADVKTWIEGAKSYISQVWLKYNWKLLSRAIAISYCKFRSKSWHRTSPCYKKEKDFSNNFSEYCCTKHLKEQGRSCSFLPFSPNCRK